MMRSIILAACFVGLRNCSASFCGESSIPFSFEVLPNGLLVLGCARPLCFGWNPNGTVLSKNGVFYKMNGYADGYVRKSVDWQMTLLVDRPLSFRPEFAQCERSFGSRSCKVEDEWVAGIALSSDATQSSIMALRCCAYERLRLSTDRGTATVTGGQMTIGGEVMKERRQYAFDYISNVEKNVDDAASVSYGVQMRRISCLPPPTEQLLDVGAKAREEIVKLLDTAVALQKNRTTKNGLSVTFQVPLISGGNEKSSPMRAHSQGRPFAQNSAPISPIPTGNFDIQQELQQFDQEHRPTEVHGVPNRGGLIDQGLSSRVGPPPSIVGAFQGQPVYESPINSGAGGGFLCFTADTVVATSDGRMVRMDKLKLSDWVLSIKNRNVAYTTLVTWTHRLPNQIAEFVKISLHDGTTLKLTKKHFIYRTQCTGMNVIASLATFEDEAVYSEEVNEGDCLYRLSENGDRLRKSKVVNVSRIMERGIYAPMTATGNIIVNGVLASCHNVVRNHALQDTFFSIVYIVNELSKWIFGSNEYSNSLIDLPLGMDIVAEVINSALPRNA